jgi:hypothetical protein
MSDDLAGSDAANRLLPGQNGCASAGAASTGEELTGELAGPSPIPIPTTDGALYLAAEVIYGEAWAARHNAEIWGAWCNDATGYSFEE